MWRAITARHDKKTVVGANRRDEAQPTSCCAATYSPSSNRLPV